MRPLPALAGLLLLLGSASRGGAGEAPPTFPGARSVLWIGAHPDDEVLAAPLLARLCLEERLACTFLVLTRGEAGSCRLPGGCLPSLGAVRAREMRRSARLFGAALRHWTLPDGGGLSGWSAAAGGEEALLGRLAAAIEASGADLVLTLDPRHGSTCHPDHRAVGAAAVEAARRLGDPPVVYLLQNVLAARQPASAYRFAPGADARAGTVGFDANQELDATDGPAWGALPRVAEIHASQFDATALQRLGRVPRRQRTVYVAPAALALAVDPLRDCD